ncbi:protein JTB isoform X1 [Engraulis encrasicolus]|uniref:protein JTB isoform X1 n=1 Tax=Engraulis encrasicolus TaxID=184585 RepID=UPI002FCED001
MIFCFVGCLGLMCGNVVLFCRVFGASIFSNADEKPTVNKPVVTLPCWQMEEFVVATECRLCLDFEATLAVCSVTGFVEQINCTKSNKGEYKSCRSSLMEEHLFWKFEGSMLGLTVLFALVVVARQRALDRLASEKVRRQIESI